MKLLMQPFALNSRLCIALQARILQHLTVFIEFGTGPKVCNLAKANQLH